MKLKKMNWGHAMAVGTVSMGFVQALSAATVLTGTGLANNTTIPAAHGSNEVGTPNVALTWDAVWDAYLGWPNDPGNGVYQQDADLDVAQTIIFTPDAGFNVVLTSLDGNDWAGGTTYDWSVVGSISGALGSGTGVAIPATSVATLNFASLTGVGSETLTLSITQRTGSGSSFAIDNLTFDQVAVPEPSSAALLGLGLGAAAMRRRRK